MCLLGRPDFNESEHLTNIIEEVYAFCCYEDGEPVPDGKGGLLEFDYIPPALYWKRWTDRYGLPREGGWLNQPFMFMKEIDAARRGEQRRNEERELLSRKTDIKLQLDVLEAIRNIGKVNYG